MPGAPGVGAEEAATVRKESAAVTAAPKRAERDSAMSHPFRRAWISGSHGQGRLCTPPFGHVHDFAKSSCAGFFENLGTGFTGQRTRRRQLAGNLQYGSNGYQVSWESDRTNPNCSVTITGRPVPDPEFSRSGFSCAWAPETISRFPGPTRR
ncbi:hypothetical protein GCM10010510_59520 [Streptomyces anandii JCM 4720]|nr:hypothetical protein GCM10010510_59520 [Streptomyces anandii JCM 4720]